MTFCTYLRTERVRKLIIVSLIFNEFSCGKMQVLKSRFQARCIFPHKLEQRMKVFARAYVENSIKSRKYSNAANKDKVFPLYA